MDHIDQLHFAEQALREQHGRRVPLTEYPGGPVIGEAELLYDEGERVLKAALRVDNLKIAEALKHKPSVIFNKESHGS